MTCQQCHADNPEGSRFCHACGAPLAAVTAAAQAATAPPPVSQAAPAPQAPAAVAGQPPLRRHVSHMGKAAMAGFALVGLLGVFIMGTAALSFMRPAVHPGARAGGITPPVIQPTPAPGVGPLAPLAPGPAAPSTGPAAPGPSTPGPAAPGATPAAPPMPAPSPDVSTPTASASSPPPASAPTPSAPAPSVQAPPSAPAAPGAKPVTPVAPHPATKRGAPAAPPVPPPAPGQAQLPLQRYRSPSGLFVISYPEGWHVQESAGQNAVVFFRDDPDEGTSFGMAMQPLPGAVSAREVLQQWLVNFQRQYPDATATVLKDTRQGGADTLAADAAWIGGARQAMRARIVVRTWTPPGSIRPWFLLMGGQAPAMAFQSVLPTYAQMVDTLTF